jgi:hypothetical protein
MLLIRVLWRGRVIEMANNGRPVIISSDRIFESFASGPPPLSSSQSNISAQVGLADDEGSNKEDETVAPLVELLQLVMTICRVLVSLKNLMLEKEIMSLINSNRGDPYDDLGEPSDDVTAALICLREMLHIEDKAIRTVSLNIATEPVIINLPTEKRKHFICPKHSRNAMVYEIAE